MNVTLSAEQIYLLGMVASFLVMIGRLLIEQLSKRKIEISQQAWIGIVYVIAFGIGVLWFPKSLPVFPITSGDANVDAVLISQYIGSLVAALTFHVFVAGILYDRLIKPVKDALFK